MSYKTLLLFLALTTAALAAEPPKDPPATLEVLQLRLQNVLKDMRIMELSYPALEKARDELKAEIQRRQPKEEKK